MTADRVRARIFGEVAAEYDRIRADYPAALVDDVLAYARPGAAPALEVGAGTGKATLAFARRGVTVDAVEPDQAMADVLIRRAGAHPSVTVTVCAFEDFVPPRPYGLLFSAQAWHWTDPAVRWLRAAAALRPGGALALFWHNDRPTDDAVMDAFRAAHAGYRDQFPPAAGPNTATGLATEWPRTELEERPEFGELSQHVYEWERTLSTADFLAYLSTQSAYRLLEDGARAELFQAIADQVGEQVRLSGQTALYLARRLPTSEVAGRSDD
jgi:SAM-dependent methyltransferase